MIHTTVQNVHYLEKYHIKKYQNKELVMRWLLFICLIGTYPFTAYTENKQIIQFKQEPVEEETEDEMIPFLLNEIIPAFGGLKSLMLSSKPSFSIHVTNRGVELTSCSVKTKVKQLKPIRYAVSEAEIQEFQVEMDIGEPRWLLLEISCGEKSPMIDTEHFHVSFSVTDDNLEPSNYSIKIKTLNQEQLDMKLVSMDMEIIVQSVDKEMLLDPYEAIGELFPTLEQHKQPNDLYLVPLSLWSPKDSPVKIISALQKDMQIELQKVNVIQIIQFKGNFSLLFPTSINGIRQDTKVIAPVNGTIHVTDTDQYIPAINFSME